MLPKKNRLNLRKTEDFFKNCKKIHLKEFSIYFRKVDSGDTQATVIVPKKTEKFAARRSRVKRIYRVALQDLVKKMRQKLQITIIVHPQGRNLSVSEVIEKINTKTNDTDNWI